MTGCTCLACQWGDISTDARWHLHCSECGGEARHHEEMDRCFYVRFFPGRGKGA